MYYKILHEFNSHQVRKPSSGQKPNLIAPLNPHGKPLFINALTFLFTLSSLFFLDIIIEARVGLLDSSTVACSIIYKSL